MISVDTKKREQLGRLPMSWAGGAAQGRARAGRGSLLFLHRAGGGAGDPVRDLRHQPRHRLGERRYRPRHSVFAVESIRRWWTGARPARLPGRLRLLITADAGGSNSYRYRVWKSELAALAAETGLAITVCHFPPGTSQVEQDRAPAVLAHHHELARTAADQPRGGRPDNREVPVRACIRPKIAFCPGSLVALPGCHVCRARW